MTNRSLPPAWRKAIALAAFLFGVATMAKAGSVLFGPPSAQQAVGNFVPFIVWFNLAASPFYMIAAAGIWLGRSWAPGLSALIMAATMLAGAAFALHVGTGGGYENQTIGALALRIGFWAIVTLLLRRVRS